MDNPSRNALSYSSSCCSMMVPMALKFMARSSSMAIWVRSSSIASSISSASDASILATSSLSRSGMKGVSSFGSSDSTLKFLASSASVPWVLSSLGSGTVPMTLSLTPDAKVLSFWPSAELSSLGRRTSIVSRNDGPPHFPF